MSNATPSSSGESAGIVPPHPPRQTRLPALNLVPEPPVLQRVLEWYFNRTPAADPIPYYANASLVGNFAVDPTALAAGAEPALLRLFVVSARPGPSVLDGWSGAGLPSRSQLD